MPSVNTLSSPFTESCKLNKLKLLWKYNTKKKSHWLPAKNLGIRTAIFKL
jgi:hypothetical protein